MLEDCGELSIQEGRSIIWYVQNYSCSKIDLLNNFFSLLILYQVTIAKTSSPNKSLPLCDLTVSLDGVFIKTTIPTSNTAKEWRYSIDTISYGVQDLVYTRVFAMIVVKEHYNIKDPNPFEVHAFVCDSR